MLPRVWWLMGVGALAACAFTVLGICVGSTGFENLLQPLWYPALDPGQTAMAQQIVWEIRLPRTVGAWMAGALLGLAGAVAQGLFRNPLADPYLLGSAAACRNPPRTACCPGSAWAGSTLMRSRVPATWRRSRMTSDRLSMPYNTSSTRCSSWYPRLLVHCASAGTGTSARAAASR